MMVRVAFVAMATLISCSCPAATSYYLDVNGATPGSGVIQGGSYDAGGTNWSTDSTGGSATDNNQTVSHGGTLIFSAGTDAAGLTYTVNGSAGQTQGGISVQEGNVNFTASGSFFGGGTVSTAAGTSLNFDSSGWDFYAQTMTFDAAPGSTITLSSISSNSGRNGGVNKTDGGLMVITGTATARGIAVTVNGGELRILNANAMYNPGYPPPSHTYTVTVNSGGSLEFSNNITVANNPVTLNGAGFNSLGALRNFAGTNTYASLITLASDSRINADTNSQLTLNPSGTNAVNGAFDLTLGGDGMINVSQPIADLTSLVKDGNGTVTFTASNSFTGPTIISNGTLRLLNGSVGGDITNNATLVISNSIAQTLVNRIAGSGHIIKQSGNRLTLAATNSFNGSIFVNTGTLALAANGSIANASLVSVTNGAVFDASAISGFTLNAGQSIGGSGVVTGAVTVVSGATLSPGLAGVTGTLSFSNTVTLTGGATNSFDLSASTNGANDQILVAGNFVFSGTNVVAIKYATLTNGTYRLVRTVGGAVVGDVTTLQIVGFVAGTQVASLATNAAGTEIDLVVAPNSHSPVNLTWAGNGGNNFWDETNTVAWRNGSTPVMFYQSDHVTFDDSGATNPVVNLVGPLAPGGLAVNATNNFTFAGSGALIGAVSLVKSNSGALTILTTNNFSGGTLIAGGSVLINNANALGTGNITNNSALVFNPSSALTFTNIISGSGSLTNLGGTLVLNGSNTFSGTVTVSVGTLQIGNPAALGATSGATVMSSGSTLDLDGQTIGAEPVTLIGGTLSNSSPAAASLTGIVTLAGNSVIAGSGDISLTGGASGNFALTKNGADTLTLAGTCSLTGPTTVSAGTLLVNGTSGTGSITISSGATLGGSGMILGAVTNQSGGTISLGPNFTALAINAPLKLNSGSTTILKVGRTVGGPANDALTGISTLTLGGTLVISLAAYPVQAGDTFQIFTATNVSGALDSVSLPWLYTGLVWDASALANGILRAVALPGVTSFAQRRMWTLDQAVENPGAVGDGFVQAEVYFTVGLIAQGQSTALSASRGMVNTAQTDFFDIWPAIDCFIRFNQYLDAETKLRIQTNITTCVQYAGTVTSNLKTLGHVIRLLGSEQFGEAAFATNAIWRSNDSNAYNDTLALLSSVAMNGFGEHASRPYYDKNLLPILTLAQLSTNPIINTRATLAFQGGLSQNAGCWMRGHLGVSTGRSYPDEENQTPMGSMRLLWLYFGGDAPPDSYEFPALAAVMNYEPLPVIQMAATNRATPYNSRGGYFGAQQNSFLDRDYVLFSEGPEYYGNFQVYADGAMWCDPNDNHFSFLWLCAPWNDNPAINSGSWPHGMNRAIYSEAQCRDSMLQIYNFNPASTNPPPYVLCYVPGGWQAMVNDAATSGKIFLHYGTMMLAISAEQTFKWDTNSGIYAVSQSPTRPGDSEFRIWGTPIPAAMQSVPNLANSYLGTWNNQFAMAMETARPDLYAGATPADQLAAFRADIYAHTGLSHAAGNPPIGYYTNRHGDTLQLKQTSALTPSPIVINGQALSLTNWPLTDNPWIYQPVGGNLSLFDGAQTIVYDFTAWTITTNSSVAPPTGLLASANSNSVFLTWSPRVGTTNYNIKRGTLSGGPYTLVGTATNILFFDTTVASGATYYYVVTASNSFGESTNSNEAAVITLPNAPSGLTATLVGRMINLKWNALSGASSYNLKRSAGAAGPFTTIAGGLTATNATDQQFPGGGTFYYVVSAMNAAGEGANSAAVSINVPANYFAAWSNRCAISFPNYTATETLSNFPALVIVSTNVTNFAYRQFASPLGRDLRFSDAALNELNYEIEKWDTNGNSFVWVQIPALTNNTLIYAWWGNPAATTAPGYTTNGAVWSGNYVGVWHLNQTPPAVELDSTANGFAATPNSNLNSASQQSGVSAGSLNFNGVNTAMNIPNTNALGLTGGQFTLSAWVNLNNATNGVIIGKGQNGSVWYSWFLSVGNNPGVDQVNTTNRLCVGLRSSGSTGDILATQTSDVTLSNWVQVVGTLDGANLNLYVNGQLNAVTPTAAIPYSNSSQLWIGADSGRDYLNGKLDELRVENAPRSPNWIAATYQNMASNSVFNSYAAATALNSNLPPSITEFSLSNGLPSLSFSGAAGFTYIVQASTNLIRWDNLLTNLAPSPASSLPDAGPGSFNQHFYRIKLAP
jgi:autotransporter-associated beta strand protein